MHLGVCCCLSCCLASLFFVSVGKKCFLLSWPQRSCSSNPSATFRGELGSLFSLRPEKMGPVEEGLVRIGRREGPLSFSAADLGETKPRGNAYQDALAHLLHLLWRGDGCQKVTRFSSVRLNYSMKPVWFLFLREKPVPSSTMWHEPVYFPWHFGFLSCDKYITVSAFAIAGVNTMCFIILTFVK